METSRSHLELKVKINKFINNFHRSKISRLPVPRSFRQEVANLGIEIVADEYILGVDSVPNVPNLQEVHFYSFNYSRLIYC